MRIKLLATLLNILGCLTIAYAQFPNWTGPTTAILGTKQSYSYKSIFSTPSFTATGGTVSNVTLSADRTTAYCDVTWTSWGLQTLTVRNNGIVKSSMEVNVVCTSVAAPTFTVKRVSDNANSNVGCVNTSFLITGILGAGGQNIRWYDSPTSTTPFHTGTSYTTPALTSSRTYYIAAFYGSSGGGGGGGGGGVEEFIEGTGGHGAAGGDDFLRTAKAVVADCESDRVAITVNIHGVPEPIIHEASFTGSVCSGGQVYIWTTGNSANVSASYGWEATFSNATGNNSGSGQVVSQYPTNASASDGTATYKLRAYASNCYGEVTRTVTIRPRPTVVASSQTICSQQTTSIPLSSSLGGSTFTWSVGAVSGVTGASANGTPTTNIAQTLSNAGTSQGYATFNVTASAPNGCSSSSATPVVAYVNPRPVLTIQDANHTVCSGWATFINVSSSIPATIQYSSSGANISGGSSGIFAGDVSDILINNSVSDATLTYTFTAATAFCSTIAPLSTNVVVLPTQRISTVPSKTICSGNNTEIAITNVNAAPAGTTYEWTVTSSNVSGASAGTSGSSLLVNQALTSAAGGTATYTIKARNSNGCMSPSTTTVVTVNPLPAQPTTLNGRIQFPNTSSTLQVTSSVQSNEQIRWYEAETGESSFLTTGTSYTTVPLSDHKTYYVETRNTTTSCSSRPRKPVYVFWLPPDDFPASPSTVNTIDHSTYTFSEEVSIATAYWTIVNGSVVSQSAPNNFTKTITVQWTAPGAGSIKLTAADNSWVYALKNVNVVCKVPLAPTVSMHVDYGSGFVPTTTGSCGPAKFKIDATAGQYANSVRWYVDQTSGTVLQGDANTYQTPTILNASKDYWIASRNTVSGCEGARTLVPATVNVIPTTAPTVSGNGRFGPGELVLTASGATPPFTYQWFNASNTAQTPGSTFTVNCTNSQTNFANVRLASSPTCFGPPTWTDVIIEPIPVIKGAHLLAMGEPTTLTTEPYASYTWRNASQQVISTARTIDINTPGVYTLTVTKAGITGSGTSLSFEVDHQFSYLNNMNFVSSTFLQHPIRDISRVNNLPVDSVKQSIQYYDGVGRLIQTVQTQTSPDKKDVTMPTVYDAIGREHKKYLPFVTTDRSSEYKADILTAGTYDGSNPLLQGDARPFSETEFETSSLNRPLKEFGPGANWRMNDKAVVHQYLVNSHGTGADQEKIIAWKISDAGLPIRASLLANFIITGGYYESGQLSVKSTKDEEGNEVREYRDKSDRVILKKVQAFRPIPPQVLELSNRDHWAQTYYIYDDLGNLRFVLQPELSWAIHLNDTKVPNTTELGHLAFQYRYDNENRMIEKQVPGAAAVYMVYDPLDRLILTQDGVQRGSRQWMFTKYDHLNRPVATGIHTADSVLVQAKMQRRVNFYYANLATNGGALNEKLVLTASGNVHGYTNKAYPIVTSFPSTVDPLNYLTVTYYDNYGFKSLLPPNYEYVHDGLSQAIGGASYSQPTSPFARIAGQVAATKVKVLDGGAVGGYTYLNTVNYFDRDNRLVQTISDNYKGGFERVSNLYDFTGKVLKTKTTTIEYDFAWKDLVSTRVEGNKLIRTGTTSGWTAGAASSAQLPAGVDGWVEMVAGNTWGNRMLGLSSQNTDANYTSIGFAIYLTGNNIRVYENGTQTFTAGTYNASDVFRIRRVGTTISYLRNGVVFHSSQATSNTPLVVDVSLHNTNDFLVNVRASFAQAVTVVDRRFNYDHAGRLLATYHRVNGNPEILLAKNEYNPVGQLVDKKLHSTQANGSDAKQSVDYRYNIRGWITSINNASVVNDGVTNNDANDLFGMNLAYDQALSGISTSTEGKYNGNISAIAWSANQGLGTIKSRGYKFSYDVLNRLLAADHYERTTGWASSTAFAEKNITYDQNGNISTLQRTNQSGALMDNLTYGYHLGGYKRNQLTFVNDTGLDNEGFKEPATTTNPGDYNYDQNGNLTIDYNREGKELLKNMSFDAGGTDWLVGGAEPSRVQFNTAGEVTIAAGAGGTATITQSIVVASGRPYLIGIDLIKTSATGSVSVSITTSAQLTASTNGTHYIAVSGSSTQTFTITVGAGFAGSIKSATLKGSDFIAYNHLNLPTLVSRSGDDQLRYIYDASGRKLVQELADKNLALKKRSDYTGELFYENDTLKFINHEEGRVVMTSATPEYQYHLKDHLGNVRLTFTTKQETESAVANYESANASAEQSKFLRTENARKVYSSLVDRTNGAADGYAQRLSGGANEKYGLARSISVMPGDVINAEVYAKYIDQNTSNWTAALSSLMSQVATASPGVVLDGVSYSASTSSFPFGAMNGTGGSTGTGPKAYLNWLIFDRSYNFKDGGYVRLSATPKENGQNVAHERLYTQITAKEAGYVYVYLSNEEGTPLEVYFDDFKVDQVKSPVVQMDDYYPFGLTFNSYLRENSVSNQYQYNNKELQDELNLGWFDYGARMYQPAIARWGVIDPLADAYYSNSGYSYVLNNPLSNQDVEGKWTVSRHNKMTLEALSQVGIGGEQAKLIAHYASVFADNPGGHIHLNNMLQNKRENHVEYRSDINYNTTMNSQDTKWNPALGYNHNIWHSMRSTEEKDAFDQGISWGISAEKAMERGMAFGWGKIFDAAESGTKLGDLKANSGQLESFGQGLHALQDAYAHKGRHDVGASHIWNDFRTSTPSAMDAKKITGSAVNVFKLLTNDFNGIKMNKKGKLTLRLDGMNGAQKKQVIKKAYEFLQR